MFLGCQSERNSNNHEPIQVKANKTFKKENHLFLNYYFGMTIDEYETATKHNFINKQLFLSGEKNTCELNRFNHRHTREDVENINKHSTVFYEFSYNNEEFEATLNPVFKHDKLVRLELQTLNCFTFGNHNHEFYRRKIEKTRQALVDLHRQKFGNYKIDPKIHTPDDLAVIKNAGVAIEQFDTNKYVFNHSNKVITIEQKCCDFKPLIIYSHAKYLEIQKQPNTPEKLEREFNLFNSAS